jgi:hypothetical protein
VRGGPPLLNVGVAAVQLAQQRATDPLAWRGGRQLVDAAFEVPLTEVPQLVVELTQLDPAMVLRVTGGQDKVVEARSCLDL